MANAIRQTAAGLTIGQARLGLTSTGKHQTVGNAVHDGDTVSTDPDGNIPVRLLGVDAPEVSFTLPNDPPVKFTDITDQRWADFLTDPFARGLPLFDPPLPRQLRAFLEQKLGPGCAANHAKHAKPATDAFRAKVSKDVADSGLDNDSFLFFLAFAHDVLDRYGRFLTFLHQDRPPGQRKPSYNRQLLDDALVVPYAIWPNIDPFRTAATLLDAVPAPGQLADQELDQTRQVVKDTRTAHKGIYEQADPLQLQPFELRYLARTTTIGGRKARLGPDRWVIDLTANDNRLHPPHSYHRIPNPEDRLFIPEEFVSLFETKGWKKQR
jgi:hypothetical protein